MPDVIAFASTGVQYKNGTAVVMADKLGNVKSVPPKFEKNVIVAQSGILDSRNDDKTYYSS